MNDFDDEYFISLSSFIEEMATVDYYLKERFNDEDIALTVEQVELETSCQLVISVDENNEVRIGAIPPMYYVETTFMPVFHNIKLNIKKQK